MTMLALRDLRPASADARLARRFRELYLRELDFVWTVLLRLGVDDVDVEDAAHDVFVVVHRQLARFEGRSSERTWLYAIARRIAWRHRRTERRRVRRRAALAAERPAEAADMDDALRDREARELLTAFLETLDRPKREAFVLGELEALPRSSLGRALGVSPGTAYSRLRAARADFAAAFGPEGPRGVMVSRCARTREPAPREVRQRVWLALPGGIGSLGGASGLVAGVVTLVVGLGVLGVVAAVVPSPGAGRGGGGDGSSLVDRGGEGQPGGITSSRASEPIAVTTAAAPAAVVTTAHARAEPRRAGVRRDGGRSSVVGAPNSALPVEAGSQPSEGTPPSSKAAAAAIENDLAEEAALLAEARAAMRAGRWAEARARLERHAERFPAGLLRTERQASAVIVACEQGRHVDALAEARSLSSGHVPEALRASLRSSCVGEHVERMPMISPASDGDQEQ